MSARAIGWSIFVVVAAAAAAGILFIGKQATDTMDLHASEFPGGVLVHIHCENHGPAPITFWIDESKLPVPTVSGKMPKGVKKKATGAHQADPVTVPAGGNTDFDIVPFFKSGTDLVSIWMNAGTNGKVADSASGSLTGDTALTNEGNRFTAVWSGTKLEMRRGGPGKKPPPPPSSGRKKGGGGGGGSE